MKTLFLVVICTIICSGVFAQAASVVEPAYKRIPIIPPFNLSLVPDSVPFTKQNLNKKRAVIVMVFSPDCDHCIHATEDLIKNINLYKKVDIVLASSLSYVSVQKFYKDLNIAAYKNISVGYDSQNFLSSFYEVRNFPSIFLYDKKGKFKEAFTDHPKFEEIAKGL